MRPYGDLMSLRKLFAIVIALALLLAPGFSRLGEASAAVPDGYHAQMIKDGHCQSPAPAPNDDQKAPAKSCCLSMCMGVTVASPHPVHTDKAGPAPTTFVVRSLHLSYLGDIATPPPKLA